MRIELKILTTIFKTYFYQNEKSYHKCYAVKTLVRTVRLIPILLYNMNLTKLNFYRGFEGLYDGNQEQG